MSRADLSWGRFDLRPIRLGDDVVVGPKCL